MYVQGSMCVWTRGFSLKSLVWIPDSLITDGGYILADSLMTWCVMSSSELLATGCSIIFFIIICLLRCRADSSD